MLLNVKDLFCLIFVMGVAHDDIIINMKIKAMSFNLGNRLYRSLFIYFTCAYAQLCLELNKFNCV